MRPACRSRRPQGKSKPTPDSAGGREAGVTALILRGALAVLASGAVSLPAWWAAGRLVSGRENAFFRLLVTIGLALVGWLGAINLVGRQLQDSRVAAGIWLAPNALAAAWLLWRRWDELSLRGLATSWRTSAPVLAMAAVAGFPQWVMAVISPYWDEVASIAIHLTEPNHF